MTSQQKKKLEEKILRLEVEKNVLKEHVKSLVEQVEALEKLLLKMTAKNR